MEKNLLAEKSYAHNFSPAAAKNDAYRIDFQRTYPNEQSLFGVCVCVCVLDYKIIQLNGIATACQYLKYVGGEKSDEIFVTKRRWKCVPYILCTKTSKNVKLDFLPWSLVFLKKYLYRWHRKKQLWNEIWCVCMHSVYFLTLL